MKIIMIIQLTVTMMLSLLLAKAEDFCTTYISQYNRFRTECNLETHAANINTCCDLRVFQFREITPISGVYTIRKGSFDTAYAYCDMTTTEGGWIVIQRNRMGSTVDFNRSYVEYERGFGNLTGDFWYGLKELQCLTQKEGWELRIDYEFKNHTKSYLHYTSFLVQYGYLNYRLLISGYQGSDVDYLRRYRLRQFSAPDHDFDDNSTANCAALAGSGFWYDGPNKCGTVNPNAQPPVVGTEVLFVEMKIRPLNCNTP